MSLEGLGQGEIGKDVTIVDDEGVALKQVGHIVDPAPCLEQDRFVSECDRGAIVARVREVLEVGLGAVVGIDDELLDPSPLQVVEREADQRSLIDGDEGFG